MSSNAAHRVAVAATILGLSIAMAIPSNASRRAGPSHARLLPNGLSITRHGFVYHPAGKPWTITRQGIRYGTARSSLSFYSGSKGVTTSTAMKIDASVSAYEDTTAGATSHANMTVGLSMFAGNQGGEYHYYNFELTRKSVKYSFTTARGKISTKLGTTGSQIDPFGSVQLKFIQTSTTTQPCDVSGSTTSVLGKLKGIFEFSTQGSSWGDVDSTSFTFPNASGYINDACVNNPGPPPGTPSCYKNLSWSALVSSGADGFTEVDGSAFGSSGNVGMFREVFFTTPANAYRSDFVSASARKPTFTSQPPGGTLVIDTKASNPFADGSATDVSSLAPSVRKSKCDDNGVTKRETARDYSALLVSYQGDELTVHSGIGGDVIVPASGQGLASDIYRDTFK